MPQLLDLPGETLSNVTKHLDTSDALTAALVCKSINQIVTPHLYHKVELFGGWGCCCLECEPHSGPEDWLGSYEYNHPETAEARRRFTGFCELISKSPAFGSHVRNLKFEDPLSGGGDGTRWAAIQKDEKYCRLFERLPQLQQIETPGRWHEIFFRSTLVLNQLRTAFLQDYDFPDIFYFLDQPLLTKIFFYEGVSGISSRQRFSKVSEMFLHGAETSSAQLSSMIRMPEKLRSLFWFRNSTHCGHEIGRSTAAGFFDIPTCDGIAASEIIPTLSSVSVSLERLVISLCRVSARCSRDQTVIGSLLTFNKLRYLHIEATLAIGISTCPAWFELNPLVHGVATRSSAEFIAMLPDSLETLSLELDCEQCDRHEYYGLVIVDALLRDRKRLTKVRTVMLQEVNARYFRTVSACRCDESSTCYKHKHWLLTDNEEDRIIAEQQKCAFVGIDLYYLAERVKEHTTETMYTRTLLQLGKEPKNQVWSFRHLTKENHLQWVRIFDNDPSGSIMPLERTCPADDLMYVWDPETVKCQNRAETLR